MASFGQVTTTTGTDMPVLSESVAKLKLQSWLAYIESRTSTHEWLTPQSSLHSARQTCRHLYESDGRFTEHHIQDWQHSAMYLAFMLAGFVDMMAHYTQLPSGIDQVMPHSDVCI